MRNVAIAAGNSGDPALLASLEPLLADAAPVVRAMAVWATARLATRGHVADLAARHLPVELDAEVRAEWRQVLL